QSRLPDPAQLPSAGSLFQNPVISQAQFAQLLHTFAAVPSFGATDVVRNPAAWLVGEAGWREWRIGSVGVHAQQALVLIHYRDGNPATAARELLDLAAQIQRDVLARFSVELEFEPTVYGAP